MENLSELMKSFRIRVVLSRNFKKANITLAAAICSSLLISRANGSPLETSPRSNGETTSQSLAVFAGLPYMMFATTVLLVAHFLAKKKGPIPVWGCLMAVWAFAWWGIRNDASTNLWLLAR